MVTPHHSVWRSKTLSISVYCQLKSKALINRPVWEPIVGIQHRVRRDLRMWPEYTSLYEWMHHSHSYHLKARRPPVGKLSSTCWYPFSLIQLIMTEFSWLKQCCPEVSNEGEVSSWFSNFTLLNNIATRKARHGKKLLLDTPIWAARSL